MKDVTAETLEGFAQQRTGASENITFAGVTLFLQSTTTIRFYLTVNSGKSIDDAIITVNGETVTPTQSGKYFYIEITDIVARNLGATYTVNFDGIEVQYSALTYAYSVLKAGTFSQDAVDAVKSLYLYYEAAVAYFNAIEEV